MGREQQYCVLVPRSWSTLPRFHPDQVCAPTTEVIMLLFVKTFRERWLERGLRRVGESRLSVELLSVSLSRTANGASPRDKERGRALHTCLLLGGDGIGFRWPRQDWRLRCFVLLYRACAGGARTATQAAAVGQGSLRQAAVEGCDR